MERTSVNSMNFDDEDEGIPESPHSSLSNASDGHFTPNFYHHHSVASSTFVRAYSDTDSAFDDSDCQQHSLPVDSHVLFFFLKSQQVSYERLCKWLESCVTDLRMKRQTEHPGFILKSLEKGVQIPVMYSEVIGEAQGANAFLSESDLCHEGINLQQAIYKKLDSISVPVISNITPHNGQELRHLIIGFRHFQPFMIETFEENWKEMSGARSLYLTPCASIGLSQINFYKRVRSTKVDVDSASTAYRDVDTFSHIVQAIFKSACGDQEIFILDMVHRLRMRMLGAMSVYAQITTITCQKE